MTEFAVCDQPALETFHRSRFMPSSGMVLNGGLAAMLVPDIVDRGRFTLWLAVGVLLAGMFLVSGRMTNYQRDQLWLGLPVRVQLIGLLSGAWVGALTMVDVSATTENEFAFMAALLTVATIVRLVMYGAMGTLRYVWLISLVASTSIGLLVAGQWLLAVSMVVLGLATFRIAVDTNNAFVELHQLRAESQQREQAATVAAESDPLTGLLNRRGLDSRLDNFNGGHCLFIDLDHFKVINDSYGHEVGDSVLRIVGQRLSAIAGDHGLAARYGGDEFLLLVDATVGPDHFVAEVLSQIRQPLDVGDGTRVQVSASVGCVQVSRDDAMDLILRRSDRALYNAKEAGRDQAVLG